MEKFRTFKANSNESAFGYEDNISNFAAIVPTDLLVKVRNTILIDLHTRRACQDRPYQNWYGAAEHILLKPAASAVMSGTPMIQFFLEMAKNTSTLSRAINLTKSKAGVSTLGSLLSSILPGTSGDNYISPASLQTNEKGERKLNVENSFNVFSNFLTEILSNPSARDNVYKILNSPSYKVTSPSFTIKSPPARVIQEMIEGFEIFGMAGKRQPLFGSDVDEVMAQRFIVENKIFSTTEDRFDMDNQFSLAIWYLMYSQIVKTPESYDAAMPVVPLTPQDGIIASHTLTMLGSITQTAITAAMAPLYVDLLLIVKQLDELVEFLTTSPVTDPKLVEDSRRLFSDIRSEVSEMAYPPVITYANTIYDYLKKLTGARYLLPDYMSEYKSLQGATPFSKLITPSEILVPPGYRGGLSDNQRVIEFGGLDVPRLLAQVKSKALDVKARLTQFSHIHNSIYSGLAMPRGSVFTHLDTLGHSTSDPKLGTIEFPTPTDVYVMPTYVPKYVEMSNKEYNWCFTPYLYECIFPTGYQLSQLTTNLSRQYFAWDTEVKIPVSPTTGADYACLLIPSNYVQDTQKKSLTNDIFTVGQHLAGSRNRPMADIADFFTPLFQSLSANLTKPEVLADALASMFFIYKRTKGTKPKGSTPTKAGGAASFDDSTSWTWIKPGIPFIYGYPTDSLNEANAPWAKGPYAASNKHVKFSPDGQFMIVLHRALPIPTNLSYIPYTMRGGVKISLPVERELFNKAITKAEGSKVSTAIEFFTTFNQALNNATRTNSLTLVETWSPSFCYFPHLFVTNRHVPSMVGTALASWPNLPTRYTLTIDKFSYLASVLAYHEKPVVGFDVEDENEVLSSSETIIDINDALAKKHHAVVEPKDTEPSKPKLDDTPPMNKPEEVVVKDNAHTNEANGKIEPDAIPPLPGMNTDLKITPTGPEASPNADENQ